MLVTPPKSLVEAVLTLEGRARPIVRVQTAKLVFLLSGTTVVQRQRLLD